MARFQLGTAFLGRYVLLGVIGEGGLSVVYQALDTRRGRRVAIKMLNRTFAGDAHAQERIRREAALTERVDHPGVPRVYEFGDAPLPDGTVVPYVVMEHITGTVLAAHLAGGPLPWPDAVRVVATVADVITAAHKRGVVHRDLTPENIMLTSDGAKVIDFGLAVTVQTQDPGEQHYVRAPRRRLSNEFAGVGEPADDVYALGVLLYQLLTGESPFPGGIGVPAPTSGAIRWVAPTPVLAVPGLPRAVAEICRRCMAKQPSGRPDAASVALDLWATLMDRPEALYHRTSTLPALPAASITEQPTRSAPATAISDQPTRSAPITDQPTRSSRPGQSASNRRTVDLSRRRRRPSWSGPTTGQNKVVRSR
ncbi:MAG TPA: serine/threonine-protein kinase [Micromonosporaceae bacterium]|nr:serine/threonine-protein kinase [Micromonosporaceae bacterium]